MVRSVVTLEGGVSLLATELISKEMVVLLKIFQVDLMRLRSLLIFQRLRHCQEWWHK